MTREELKEQPGGAFPTDDHLAWAGRWLGWQDGERLFRGLDDRHAVATLGRLLEQEVDRRAGPQPVSARALMEDRDLQARQFQRETRRTSELSRALEGAVAWCGAQAVAESVWGPWRELLDRPLGPLE